MSERLGEALEELNDRLNILEEKLRDLLYRPCSIGDVREIELQENTTNILTP